MKAAALVAGITACGLYAGFLLFRRATFVPLATHANDLSDVTVIIPARNEAANLVPLLQSLRNASAQPASVLVVDDESTDETPVVARSVGAQVLPVPARPAGWKGKPWACWHGAHHASTPLLLFVDADTRFCPDGLQRIRSLFGSASTAKALSVLPHHQTVDAYEQLSLFFNILVAAGAGGFSGLDDAHGLFGQSMLIQRDLYFRAGGHAAVREHVLENFHFAANVRAAGGLVQTALGRGVLSMRMFPEGAASLCASWLKGFAGGAGATPRRTMLLSIGWLTGGAMPVVAAFTGSGETRIAAILSYCAYAVQTRFLAGKVGSYRWYAAAAYAVPLMFYFVLFSMSASRGRTRQTVLWKGRPV